MASYDMNKPASSTWTSPNVARSNAGKSANSTPTRGKMASENETKSTSNSSNRTTPVASNMDIPAWQNNVALELILLSMYGAGNLPLLTNPGSIPHFGLFPLGLPPVPVMAQNNDVSRVPTSSGRAIPKPVHKSPSNAINLTKTGNASRGQLGTTTAVDMSQQSRVKVTERPVARLPSSKSSTLDASNMYNLGAKPMGFSNVPCDVASLQKAIVPSPVSSVTGSLLARSNGLAITKVPNNRTAAPATKMDMSRASSYKAIPSKTLPIPNVGKVTTSPSSYVKPGGSVSSIPSNINQTHANRNHTRIVGSYAAKTIQLPHDSQFRDAEAAAILLGLRHGLVTSGPGPVSGNGKAPSLESMQAIRMGRNSNETRVTRTQDKAVDFSQPAPAQAVDLSTKTKLKSQAAARPSTINSKYNSIKPTHQRTMERQKQQNTPPLSTKKNHQVGQIPRARPTNNRKQASALSNETVVKTQQRLSPSRANAESTSVVSHLPSCICAFDCPSHIEGCSKICTVADKMLQGQHYHQTITGFNFKKAICEKFSQVSTCSGKDRPTNLSYVRQSYAVAESTSRASMEPTWSQKHRTTPTHSSAIQKSLKSQERMGHSIERQHMVHTPVSRAISTQSPTEKVPPVSARSCQPTPVIGCTPHTISILPKPVSATIASHEIQVPGTSTERDLAESPKVSNGSSIQLQLPASTSAISTTASINSQRVEFRQTVPSFSALRQKSAELRTSFDQSEVPTPSITAKNMAADGSVANLKKNFKPPISNLYRIRNSGFGGSNDSLHSNHSDTEAQKHDSGEESDSSGSGSDSESSGGANSDESDAESDRGDPAAGNRTKETRMENGAKNPASPSRSRFVLSRPKFTLGSTDASSSTSSPEKTCPVPGSGSPAKSGISSSSPGSKVRIRRPTFTFSSSESNTVANDIKEAEKVNKPPQAEIPELKCDKDEGQNSFKFKLLQALSKPDSKEGLAVDGKSLRALLGEADCFYHNNKKYVLKRYLTKTKPKEDFIANVAGSNGILSPSKHSRRDTNSNVVQQRKNQPRIEPRISVTARKRTDEPEIPEIKPKKLKKSKRRALANRNKKRSFSEVDEGRKRVNLETKSSGKHGMPRNKRRRRIHEIDNLVFEGAGGLTPIPDLSLRDSDVFSNIKLRRREAAKRGIVETVTETEKQTKKSSLRTKWLKNAAHRRAIVNKNRKKSIEKKLKKYRKKKRYFLVSKHMDAEVAPSRSSCVRISAGVGRPHLDSQAFATSEVEKFPNNSITEHEESPHDRDSICTAIPENTHSLSATESPLLKRHGVVLKKRVLEKISAKSSVTKPEQVQPMEKTVTDGISDDQSTEGSENLEDGGRRASKRISQRKVSVDPISDIKKLDDDVTICDSDSVRSDSPLPSVTRGTNIHRRRKPSTKGRASPYSTKVVSSRSSRAGTTSSRGRRFSLTSCFIAPSAITLAAGFGDLQPSYSTKGKLGQNKTWGIGANALDTKQQLQREIWRNMTLDMFTNGGNKVSINNVS